MPGRARSDLAGVDCQLCGGTGHAADGCSMRETAIMDILNTVRGDDSDGGWLPTAEKVIGSEALSGSFLGVQASQFEPPVTAFGAADVADQAAAARPPGFGPPKRAAGGSVAPGGPPVLSAEDLEALAELANDDLATWPPGGAGGPGVQGGVGAAGAGGVGLVPASSPASGAVRAGAGSGGAAADAVLAGIGRLGGPRRQVEPAPTTDRARIVQPIPTWPPAGQATVPSLAAPASAKNIGPVPSRHRPDPRREARRRFVLAFLLVVLAVVGTWFALVKVHHRHAAGLGHVAPAFATAVMQPAPGQAFSASGAGLAPSAWVAPPG